MADKSDLKNVAPIKKQPVLRDIEDVVSVAALLRPTIVEAVDALKIGQKHALRTILIDAEKYLAQSHYPFRTRFENATIELRKTYEFGPIWRFIAGRVEASWHESTEPGVKELSQISLLVGMLFEEVTLHLPLESRKKRIA